MHVLVFSHALTSVQLTSSAENKPWLFHASVILSGMYQSYKNLSYRPHTKYDGRICFHRCVSVHRGYPQPLVPGPFWGYSLVLSWILAGGYPQPGLGVPLTRTGKLYLGHDREVPAPPPGQESKCCYATSGRHLAVTQENFFVFGKGFILCSYKCTKSVMLT